MGLGSAELEFQERWQDMWKEYEFLLLTGVFTSFSKFFHFLEPQLPPMLKMEIMIIPVLQDIKTLNKISYLSVGKILVTLACFPLRESINIY